MAAFRSRLSTSPSSRRSLGRPGTWHNGYFFSTYSWNLRFFSTEMILEMGTLTPSTIWLVILGPMCGLSILPTPPLARGL